MRQPKEYFVVTFATTTGAMAMEEACRTQNIPGRLIPVPRSITAGCGMCWAAPPDASKAVEQLVIREKLDVSGLYSVFI
jgi:hypothetical protein